MRTQQWLLSYDIASDRQRRAIAKWALAHGARLQRSLYALTLTHDSVQQAAQLAHRSIDPAGDRLLLRPVCRACQRAVRLQGVAASSTHREPFWIV
mgnify:CR=1 FL=1